MSGGAVVHELRRKLQKELISRQRQEEVNAKLQDEYDHLLKRLAEAELHIDRLRLGPSVDINKRFIVRRGVEQRTRPRERLQPQLGSSLGVQSGSGQANEGPKRSGVQLSVGINTEPSEVAQNGMESSEPLEEVKESTQSLSGGAESQVSLSNISSVHSTESLSQMSSENIASRVSAESTQMAHLFQIRNLQEQMTALKEKINSGGASVGDIMASLRKIREEHRQLVADIASSNANLDSLNRRDSRHLVHSQEAIGDELSSLADQLRDLEELLRTKGGELLHSPASTSETHMLHSATESERLGTTASEGDGGDLSDHSFNSPVLPSKYTFILDDNHSPPITTPPDTPPHLHHSPPHSNSHNPSLSQSSGLDVSSPTPTRHDGRKSPDTLSEKYLPGELSSQLLHRQSSNDSGSGSSCLGRRMPAMEATTATTTSDSLLIAIESMSSFQQFSSANSSVAPSHTSHPPPPTHSPPPPPIPVVTRLQPTLNESESGTATRDAQLPPHHHSHLDPTHSPDHTHTKAPPTNSHDTSSNGQSPLTSGFKPAPYPTHPPPGEWFSSQREAESGFAGSELPRMRPDSGFASSEPPRMRPDSGFASSEPPRMRPDSGFAGSEPPRMRPDSGFASSEPPRMRPDSGFASSEPPRMRPDSGFASSEPPRMRPDSGFASSEPPRMRPDSGFASSEPPRMRPDSGFASSEPPRMRPDSGFASSEPPRMRPDSGSEPPQMRPDSGSEPPRMEPENGFAGSALPQMRPDSGFASSELPQRRPDSVCPETTSTAHYSMADNGTTREEEEEENQDKENLPSLTTAAIDALRAELEELKNQILNSTRPQPSTPSTPHHLFKHKEPLNSTRLQPSTPSTPHHLFKHKEPLNSTRPHHHSAHTEPLYTHPWMTTNNEPPVSMTTTVVGLQTDWIARDTLPASLSAQVAPLTCTKATNTPVTGPDSPQAWQQPVRSFHQGSQTDHLLQSPPAPRAHGERYSTSPPPLLRLSQLGKMSMEQSEVEQKLSFGHNSMDSEMSSSVCSHSADVGHGHDRWVCSKCEGAGSGSGEGTTAHVQGQKHKKRGNRGAQVTFDYQEGDEVENWMSGPKVSSYHAHHLPSSSKLGGSNTDDPHLLDTNRYQPMSSRLATEYMFQPSVLFSQRPVATSTPSNLNKYRHAHIRKGKEYFSPSITPGELPLSLQENFSGATPRHTRVRKRTSHRRHPDTHHILLADSSSEDEQEVGYASPEQYFVLKKRTKPWKTGYYSGASYTPKRSQFGASCLPATDEVYFSDPTVVNPQRRRRSGVRRVAVAKPQSVEGMYVVEGEESSGSEAETIEAVSLDLSDACRLARKMSRRSRRMHGTLQIELGRQSSLF